jgi:hypothetical protein
MKVVLLGDFLLETVWHMQAVYWIISHPVSAKYGHFPRRNGP